jgi:hypothetical protein
MNVIRPKIAVRGAMSLFCLSVVVHLTWFANRGLVSLSHLGLSFGGPAAVPTDSDQK